MCTTFIAKLVLGIVNTLVFLVGLVMFIVGILIRTEPAFSKEALSSVLAKLEDSAKVAGIELDTSGFSVAEIAYSFTIALIVVGLFLAGVSLLGLIAVKYSLKPLLIVYFLVTLVLFLAQLVVVMVAVIDREVFDEQVKPHLKTTIKDYYEGINSTDPTTQIWNGIMIELKCCGVDDSKDFDDASKWPKKVHTTNITIPLACCKEIKSNDYSCAKSPTDVNSYKDIGCYSKIWDYIMSNSGLVIGIATGVLFAQMLILLLTCIIINSVGKVGPV